MTFKVSEVLLLTVFSAVNIALYVFSYDGATFKEGADASQYYIPALSLIEYGEFLKHDSNEPFTVGTPLYSILLAMPIYIFGIDESAAAIILIQSTLLYITGFLSRLILLQFTNKFGLLLHIFVVFNPNSIITSHLVQRETLFTLLITWSIFYAFKVVSSFSLKSLIFLGILTGLATLTRPVGLYLLIFWPIFLLFSLIIKNRLIVDNKSTFFKRELWLRLLIVVIIGGIVVSPWYIRNYINTNNVFLSSNSGYYLQDQYFQLKNKGSGWESIDARKEHERILLNYLTKNGKDGFCINNSRHWSCNDILTRVSIKAIINENAITHIKALSDSWLTLFLAGGASNIRNYLGIDGKDLIVKFQNSSFKGFESILKFIKSVSGSYLFIFILTTVFTVVSRIFGLIGVFYLIKNKEWRPYGFLLIEVILIFTASYLYLGQSRFRVPLEPFLMLFTVIGIFYMYQKYRFFQVKLNCNAKK